MKTFRVRYSLWRINANSAAEANTKICQLLRTSPETYVFVEEESNKDEKESNKDSFLKRLWTGR